MEMQCTWTCLLYTSRTIEKIVELAPDSLTVHSLAIKRASRLNQWIQENGVSTVSYTHLDVYKRQPMMRPEMC